MAKFEDYVLDSELADIMESLADAFPEVFEGFRPDMVKTLKTMKKSAKQVIKIHRIGYPKEVFCGQCAYIVEAFLPWWGDMNQKQKNLAVFHVMCAVKEGGFDEQSSGYGKLRQYDYRMYKEEFAVTGGIPDWWDNPAARDPMDVAKENEEEEDDGIVRVPMTKEDVEGVAAGNAQEEDEEEEEEAVEEESEEAPEEDSFEAEEDDEDWQEFEG